MLAPMTVAVRTEDVFGNPIGGWSGEVMVMSHGAAKWNDAAADDEHLTVVTLVDGYGTAELVSEIADSFELSLQTRTPRSEMRLKGPIRATFSPLEAALAVFGELERGPHPVGTPLQVPLQVMDRLGNVADDFEGEIQLNLSGGARIAGGAPSVFQAVGGRATLPVRRALNRACAHLKLW